MRGQFLLDYIELLVREGEGEGNGFRHTAPAAGGRGASHRPARGRERWVVNKIRALASWYTKGVEGGARLRVAVNGAESVQQVRDIVAEFFLAT